MMNERYEVDVFLNKYKYSDSGIGKYSGQAAIKYQNESIVLGHDLF